ncbi:hypothetical protein [Streptomyces sp. NPDC048419]|uniref:GntT/GntP/DsdX family permease n=1 Tax=Streptomyces sp. NPDC048419 TaxID=3365547 RepID=UPI00371C72B3
MLQVAAGADAGDAGGGGGRPHLCRRTARGDARRLPLRARRDPRLLGWLVALLLSLTTGSATVGIVSATGIVAPLIGSGGGLEASLLVIAIGAGSLGLNYVNHAGFWLVKESFGMDLAQAAKTQTVVQTLVSVLGLVMALLLSVFVRGSGRRPSDCRRRPAEVAYSGGRSRALPRFQAAQSTFQSP